MEGYNPHSGSSLYDLIGVSSNASQSEIKAAYRTLAKRYHPDVNPSPEAQNLMREINYAYSILNDPARRAAYDESLIIGKEIHEERETNPIAYAESFAQQVRCQSCGKFDHTLRIAAFPYVISILIVTFKRYEAGLFCDKCRSVKSTKWAVISLLFGIWGFPFGIIFTVESLFVNALKGKKPREENKELLRQLAWVNFTLGNIGEAKAALIDLLRYDFDKEAKQLLQELRENYPTIHLKRPLGLRFGFLIIISAIFALYAVIVNAVFGNSSDTSIPNAPSPVQTFPINTPTNATETETLRAPDDSYISWEDNSIWVSNTTVRVVGSVTNSHDSWSISNVRIIVKLFSKQGSIVESETVYISPVVINPSSQAKYSKIITVQASCESFRTALEWYWEPP